MIACGIPPNPDLLTMTPQEFLNYGSTARRPFVSFIDRLSASVKANEANFEEATAAIDWIVNLFGTNFGLTFFRMTL